MLASIYALITLIVVAGLTISVVAVTWLLNRASLGERARLAAERDAAVRELSETKSAQAAALRRIGELSTYVAEHTVLVGPEHMDVVAGELHALQHGLGETRALGR